MKDRKLEVKWRDNSPIPDQRIQELDLDYGIDVTIQIRKNATIEIRNNNFRSVAFPLSLCYHFTQSNKANVLFGAG